MKTSIIYNHWASNEERSKLMRDSIISVIETCPDAEILVADNGGSLEDSEFLLKLTDEGKIARYVRYRVNMHFDYARNDCLSVATGDYFVISDNDIIYKKGWLEECINWLENNPGKYYATPLQVIGSQARYTTGFLNNWKLNMRAGSNSFVIRKTDFNIIGNFPRDRLSGSMWTNNAVRAGYLCTCMPEPKAFDFGRRHMKGRGYNYKLVEIKESL